MCLKEVPSSDGAELYQSSDRVLMQRVLAGRVVEAGLHRVAVAQGAAAGKHPRWRGHFLWRKEVVVGQRFLKRVCVIVCEAVSVDWQHVGGLVAAEAGGGRRGRGLTEGQRGAGAAQGERRASG